MALLTEKPVTTFDLTQIKCGYLLWGKHNTWNEGKAGFVTSATESRLVVQYHPNIGNVTNHFMIPVSEVIEGQWEIKWSVNLSDVQGYHILAKDKSEETKKVEEVLENYDSGGINL